MSISEIDSSSVQRLVKMNINVPAPSKDQVDCYLAKWERLENYQLQKKSLAKLFFNLCPENCDITDIISSLRFSSITD